jgi:hypothetical protein
MVKSCSPPGERLKRSILVHILLNKEPSLVADQSQQLLAGTGILRNPEDSGVNTGIPVPQEFLRKSPVKTEKTGIPATSPKPRSCEKFPWKTQEKKEILRNPGRNGFLGPKNKFLKTGIGNLVTQQP